MNYELDSSIVFFFSFLVSSRKEPARKPRKNLETFLLGQDPDHSWRNRSVIPVSSAKVLCASCVDLVTKCGEQAGQTKDAFCVGNVVGSVQKGMSEAWRCPENASHISAAGFHKHWSLNWWSTVSLESSLVSEKLRADMFA